jgi:hypothetical protein
MSTIHNATALLMIFPFCLTGCMDPSLMFQALYDDMVPAFDVLGKRSFFLGEIGNGAKMKLVVNMIMGR